MYLYILTLIFVFTHAIGVKGLLCQQDIYIHTYIFIYFHKKLPACVFICYVWKSNVLMVYLVNNRHLNGCLNTNQKGTA